MIYDTLINPFPLVLFIVTETSPQNKTLSSSHVGQLQAKAVVWLCKETMSALMPVLGLMMSGNSGGYSKRHLRAKSESLHQKERAQNISIKKNVPTPWFLIPKTRCAFIWIWVVKTSAPTKKQGTSPLIPYQWCSCRPTVMAGQYSRSHRHLSPYESHPWPCVYVFSSCRVLPPQKKGGVNK